VLTSFWEGLGGKLAERWAASSATPAFLFWAGGVVAWAAVHDDGWGRIKEWTTGLDGLPSAVQAAAVIAPLLFVAASAVAMQAASLSLLRALEGYWPRPLHGLRRRIVARRVARVRGDDERFQVLAGRIDADDTLTGDEELEYLELDRRRREAPALEERRLPTRLGNILRSAELRPLDKYGLDAVICWPRLWLLLPAETKQNLNEARAALDSAARLVGWGVLFAVWTVWTWWALLIAAVVAVAGYRRALGAASVYGDLLESVFDLHRGALYEALRWPLPRSPAEEQRVGRELTRYLVRGGAGPTPLVTAPPVSAAQA
jgi:hypothetical protein